MQRWDCGLIDGLKYILNKNNTPNSAKIVKYQPSVNFNRFLFAPTRGRGYLAKVLGDQCDIVPLVST